VKVGDLIRHTRDGVVGLVMFPTFYMITVYELADKCIRYWQIDECEVINESR
jgi:hypothetical protein